MIRTATLDMVSPSSGGQILNMLNGVNNAGLGLRHVIAVIFGRGAQPVMKNK